MGGAVDVLGRAAPEQCSPGREQSSAGREPVVAKQHRCSGLNARDELVPHRRSCAQGVLLPGEGAAVGAGLQQISGAGAGGCKQLRPASSSLGLAGAFRSCLLSGRHTQGGGCTACKAIGVTKRHSPSQGQSCPACPSRVQPEHRSRPDAHYALALSAAMQVRSWLGLAATRRSVHPAYMRGWGCRSVSCNCWLHMQCRILHANMLLLPRPLGQHA